MYFSQYGNDVILEVEELRDIITDYCAYDEDTYYTK